MRRVRAVFKIYVDTGAADEINCEACDYLTAAMKGNTMKIGISADSTCDLSPELIEKYNVAITPLTVVVDGKNYRDLEEIDPDMLFALVEETGKIGSTSAVNVGEYEEFFEKRLGEYDALIHFTISGEMSACYQNACLAAQDRDNIFVVDSRNLSTGIGLLVLEAAEMAADGIQTGEIFDRLQAKKEKLDVSFVLHTLDYLRKGGRCSAIASLGANLLKLRPCIKVSEGKMGVAKKYKGSMESALEKYVKDQLAEADTLETKRIFITHTGVSAETADKVRGWIAECAGFDEILETRAGCTVSCHSGPLCLGILFFRK